MSYTNYPSARGLAEYIDGEVGEYVEGSALPDPTTSIAGFGLGGCNGNCGCANCSSGMGEFPGGAFGILALSAVAAFFLLRKASL